jgi:hypothetical protein
MGKDQPRGEGGDPAKRESRVRGFFNAGRGFFNGRLSTEAESEVANVT